MGDRGGELGDESASFRGNSTGGLENEGKKLGTFASRELGEFASFCPFSEPSGTEGCLSGIDVGGS